MTFKGVKEFIEDVWASGLALIFIFCLAGLLAVNSYKSETQENKPARSDQVVEKTVADLAVTEQKAKPVQERARASKPKRTDTRTTQRTSQANTTKASASTYGNFQGWVSEQNCRDDTAHCVVVFTNNRVRDLRLHSKHVCYWADTPKIETINKYYHGSWRSFASIDEAPYAQQFPTLLVQMPSATRNNVGRLYVVRMPNGLKDCMNDHVKALYDRTMNQHLIIDDGGNSGVGR